MKCAVDHCGKAAVYNVEVIVGDVWLCPWHNYWAHIPAQSSAVEAKIEEKA